MTNFKIPQELIEMITQRRVIPFIGAGFSSSLNLPNWETLLKNISKEIENSLPYEEVALHCANNPLEIAEYYFIKSNNNIGPLRYAINNSLRPNINPLLSGPHIELVNLGAPQIYTTNYDDLIEKTYKNLGLSPQVICLAKDVAMSTNNRTQIIKYHGDLKYEETLVLTESSYFSRMDFDSPMDIKFRADLLGKSVLFMGYSFRDINIRIIWFKLMKMMKDISIDNRPNSYILRFNTNPVLEELYESVGIKSIILDPNNKSKKEDWNLLFSDFMLELSKLSSVEGKIPGSEEPQIVSMGLINKCKQFIESYKEDNTKRKNPEERRKRNIELRRNLGSVVATLDLLISRYFSEELKGELNAVLNDMSLLSIPHLEKYTAKLAIKLLHSFGYMEVVSFGILTTVHDSEARKAIIDSNIDWKQILGYDFTSQHAKKIINTFEREFRPFTAGFFFNADTEGLAYLIDIVKRISVSESLNNSDPKVTLAAKQLLEQSVKVFPFISEHKPSESKINISKLLQQIEKAIKENEDNDDLPF
jgi:SIR2-like domain